MSSHNFIGTLIVTAVAGTLGFIGGQQFESSIAPAQVASGDAIRPAIAITEPTMDRVASTSSEPTCPSSKANASTLPDTADLIRHGTENERFDALTRAETEGSVSDLEIDAIAASDQSPRVRLLAFEMQLQRYEGDSVALRRALEAAQRRPDWVVSQDAGRRLVALGPAASAATLPGPQRPSTQD